MSIMRNILNESVGNELSDSTDYEAQSGQELERNEAANIWTMYQNQFSQRENVHPIAERLSKAIRPEIGDIVCQIDDANIRGKVTEIHDESYTCDIVVETGPNAGLKINVPFNYVTKAPGDPMTMESMNENKVFMVPMTPMILGKPRRTDEEGEYSATNGRSSQADKEDGYDIGPGTPEPAEMGESVEGIIEDIQIFEDEHYETQTCPRCFGEGMEDPSDFMGEDEYDESIKLTWPKGKSKNSLHSLIKKAAASKAAKGAGGVLKKAMGEDEMGGEHDHHPGFARRHWKGLAAGGLAAAGAGALAHKYPGLARNPRMAMAMGKHKAHALGALGKEAGEKAAGLVGGMAKDVGHFGKRAYHIMRGRHEALVAQHEADFLKEVSRRIDLICNELSEMNLPEEEKKKYSKLKKLGKYAAAAGVAAGAAYGIHKGVKNKAFRTGARRFEKGYGKVMGGLKGALATAKPKVKRDKVAKAVKRGGRELGRAAKLAMGVAKVKKK
jgi:hypothetical protein